MITYQYEGARDVRFPFCPPSPSSLATSLSAVTLLLGKETGNVSPCSSSLTDVHELSKVDLRA